jgi:hypothetical protein
MMGTNYADLADASVLLVFEDGEEERCHTFPLAARYPGTVYYR